MKNLHPLKVVERKGVYGTHTTGGQSSLRTPEHTNEVRWPEGAGEEKINPEASTHLLRSPSSTSPMFFWRNLWRYCRTLRCNDVVPELFSRVHRYHLSAPRTLRTFQCSFVVCRLSACFYVWCWKVISNVHGMVQNTHPVLVQESPLSAHSHDITYHQHTVLTPMN